MADPTLGQESAGGGAEDLELEPENTPTGEDKEPNDPLDDIKDETARAQAKKDRAIARRKGNKPEGVVEKPEPKSSDFLTKQDFEKANERKAILTAQADPEVKAIWNEIVPFYTPRRGKATPEDISEDIKDAITLYKARNPDPKEKDTSAADLTTTPVVKVGGGATDKSTTKPKDPPNFSLPRQPKDWFPKKNKE